MWEQITLFSRKWRRFLPAYLVALLIACAPGSAHAQDAGGGRAIILQPFNVVNTQDLDFGNIISGDTAGTVLLDVTNGNRTSTGGVILQGSRASRAQFQIFGLANQIVTLNVPTNIVITHSNGTDSMAVDQMTIGFRTFNFGPAVRGRFTTAFAATFNVAGRLNVGANQQPGTYSGTFDMTVDFE